MSLSSLIFANSLVYGPFTLVALIILHYIRVWYRLRAFGGPFLASISELWLARAALSGKFHENLLEQNKNHGCLARIGPNELLTDDPDILYHMSAAKEKHQKALWYSFIRFNPFTDNIFSELDVRKHDKLRAIMGPAYATKNNPKIEKLINSGVQSFITYIETHIAKDPPFCTIDFSMACQYFALDVISEYAFGEPFASLPNDKDLHGYHHIFADLAPILSVITTMPSLTRILNTDLAKKFWAPTTKDAHGTGKLMAMARDYVKDRTESGEEKDDMLGSFLKHGMTPLQAEAEILTQLSAGTDSNSVALRGIFLHVFTSPQVYNKLQEEIDSFAASGLISNPVTNTESLKLPYLNACIREGMRVWPPFTGLTTKKINPGGEVIKGTFIPGGTSIATSFWGFQRNPVFGKDVEAFRPERWIEASDDKRKEMERVNDLVFGSGRWSCLGKTIVLMEMRQVIVELMRHFEFTITQPTKPWVSKSYVFMLIEQMPVRVSKRVNKSFREIL